MHLISRPCSDAGGTVVCPSDHGWQGETAEVPSQSEGVLELTQETGGEVSTGSNRGLMEDTLSLSCRHVQPLERPGKRYRNAHADVFVIADEDEENGKTCTPLAAY